MSPPAPRRREGARVGEGASGASAGRRGRGCRGGQARPGARRENLDNYIKRLESLELLANSFEGVERSYAMQAGRELRLIVKPETIDDLGAARLAHEVARKIESQMDFPGQIKVTVIRETRASEVAK